MEMQSISAGADEVDETMVGNVKLQMWLIGDQQTIKGKGNLVMGNSFGYLVTQRFCFSRTSKCTTIIFYHLYDDFNINVFYMHYPP